MVELTEQLIKELCGYLEDVGFDDIACPMAGVSPEQLAKWEKEADEPGASSLHLKLKRDLRKSRIKAEYNHAKNVNYAGMGGDVKASMFILEALAPQRWKRKGEVSDNGVKDINIKIQAVKPTFEIEEEELDYIDV